MTNFTSQMWADFVHECLHNDLIMKSALLVNDRYMNIVSSLNMGRYNKTFINGFIETEINCNKLQLIHCSP